MNVVFITGANRGIGLGFVQHYLKEGWRVFAAARNPDASDIFQQLAGEAGDRLIPVTLDVGHEASIKQAAQAVRSSGASLDVLINNAGISYDENLGQWTPEHFASSFSVNVTGPALLTQALMGMFQEGAKVINLSSGMGSLEINVNPDNGCDAYAVSKAGLNMLTRRLAEKVRDRGIAAIALSPGWVRTDMGGDQAPLSVEESVALMAGFIERLNLEHSGACYTETGEQLPW